MKKRLSLARCTKLRIKIGQAFEKMPGAGNEKTSQPIGWEVFFFTDSLRTLGYSVFAEPRQNH